jgi:hypothetical protein
VIRQERPGSSTSQTGTSWEFGHVLLHLNAFGFGDVNGQCLKVLPIGVWRQTRRNTLASLAASPKVSDCY